MQSIRAKIQDANSELFNHLHQINAQKLGQLVGPQIISDSSPENFKTVVTIPENLLLSNSEKSVLDKGLNFVPISWKTDEFLIKWDFETYFAAFSWKPFFMKKGMILTPRTKILSKHFSLNGLRWLQNTCHFGSVIYTCREALKIET